MNKLKPCCRLGNHWIHQLADEECRGKSFFVAPLVGHDFTSGNSIVEIIYCPFCGKKLPEYWEEPSLSIRPGLKINCYSKDNMKTYR